MKQFILLCLLMPMLVKGQPSAVIFNATKKIVAETPTITSFSEGSGNERPVYTYCHIQNDSWVSFYQVMRDSTVQEKKVRLYDLQPSAISPVQESAAPVNKYYQFRIGENVVLHGKNKQALESLRQAFSDLVSMSVNEFPQQVSSEKKEAIVEVLNFLNTHYQECYQSFDWYFRKFEDNPSSRKKTNFFSRWVLKGDSILYNAFSGYLSDGFKCEIYAYTIPIHYSHFTALVQDGDKSYIRLSGFYKPLNAYVYSQGSGSCSMRWWDAQGVSTVPLYLAQNKVKSNYMLWADVKYEAGNQQRMNTYFKTLQSQ